MADTAGRRGSVRRDPRTNTWTIVVDAGDVGASKRRQIRRRGFRTERDAQRALTAILAELDRGCYVAPDLTTTLADYVTATWLPALSVRRRRPSTLESYRRNLEIHVIPVLGHWPLARIGPAELDRLYADLLAEQGGRRPLSPRSVRYIHTILHGVFAHAVLKGYLGVNPCIRADAREPRACRSRQMKTWTAEQLQRFLESLPHDRFRAALWLLATTGMRRGEVLGLTWADVRLDAAELDVRRTLGSVDNELVVTEPKTSSGRRTVSLDPTTVAVLRQHRSDQLQRRLAAGDQWQDEGWVSTQPDGRPLHPTRFGRVFQRRLADAGLPRIRVHDLRHTWASLALQAGVNPKIVQERMGHASVAITLDLYTHTDRVQHAAAAQAVAQLFSPAPDAGASDRSTLATGRARRNVGRST